MKKNVFVARPPEVYDAIVVGSGISGGWAAKELCELGLKTLVLERGRPIEHGKDYITEHMPPWQTPFRGLEDRKRMLEDHYIQMQAGPVNEYNIHFLSMIEKIRTRTTPTSLSCGFAVIRWAVAPSCGDARATAGATWTLRRTRAKALPSTGRFGIGTWPPGTTM